MPTINFSNNLKRWIGRCGKRFGRFIQYWGEDADATMDKWVLGYRKQGIRIGENAALWNVSFDPIYPELITIGDNVTITNAVILTHDDSPVTFTMRRRVAPVNIGDDVFVGWNTLILPGVTIGNNCIIGAGSVVTRSIPDNTIAVGVPAKVVKSMPDHIQHLEVDPFLLQVRVNSNRISEHEHEAMRRQVLEKYRPELVQSIETYTESSLNRK